LRQKSSVREGEARKRAKMRSGSSGRTRTYNPSVNSPRNLAFTDDERHCYSQRSVEILD
jgi:hypothetical protein